MKRFIISIVIMVLLWGTYDWYRDTWVVFKVAELSVDTLNGGNMEYATIDAYQRSVKYLIMVPIAWTAWTVYTAWMAIKSQKLINDILKKF